MKSGKINLEDGAFPDAVSPHRIPHHSHTITARISAGGTRPTSLLAGLVGEGAGTAGLAHGTPLLVRVVPRPTVGAVVRGVVLCVGSWGAQGQGPLIHILYSLPLKVKILLIEI